MSNCKAYCISCLFIDIFLFKPIKIDKKKKIGVISLQHHQNIGNNLLKYAIFIKLSELGFDPYIIGTYAKNSNISFLKNNVRIRIIKRFSEIRKKDYDILIVNSDQTWRKWRGPNFYNIAFLKFAEKWNIPKFIYGTSIRHNTWTLNKDDEIIAKRLLKKFTGISVRDIGLVELIKNHLRLEASFVLDPTLLINKKYYLKIIENYKNDCSKMNYIFTYKLKKSSKIAQFKREASIKLNYSIFNVDMNENEYVEKFIFGIYHCKALITSSFHGTIFAMIFNKPFISFKGKNDERLDTLKRIFNFKHRILNLDEIPNYLLLKEPLSFNRILLDDLKMKSIRYLRKNLNITNSFNN